MPDSRRAGSTAPRAHRAASHSGHPGGDVAGRETSKRPADQQAIRNRFVKAFRYIISQRLLPRKDGQGRVAAIEILKSTLRTRECIEKGEKESRTLLDAMRDGELDGMQEFDGQIERLVRAGVVDKEVGLAFATNAGYLLLQLTDLGSEPAAEIAPP